MKSFVQAFFAFALGVTIWTAIPVEAARADTMPECLQSSTRKIPDASMQEWWDKRKPDQQNYIRNLPCDERYIPMVCIFLFDPDLKGCTNKGVAEYRANKACEAKGLDILSEEMLDCKNDFKKSFKVPFS